MAISFRTTRNLGLGLLLFIVLLISFFSYRFVLKSSGHVSVIVGIEEKKLQKWYDLVKLITLSKDRLYEYQKSRGKIIASAMVLINRAMDTINEIELVSTDKNELDDLYEIKRRMKIYKQSVFVYGAEIKAGYKNGETANEMESLAITSADDMFQLSWDIVDSIHRQITHRNNIVLNQALFYKKILGFGLALAVIFTILVALLMARALSRPLRQLLVGTQRIAKGELDYQVTVESRDEIGHLANSFNKMAGSLKTLLEREKEFLEAEAKIAAEKQRSDEFAALNQQLKANEKELKAANQQLKANEKELKAANQQLVANEQALLKTQGKLKKKLADLELYKEVTVGRELKMIDLKKEINALLKKFGGEPKYKEMDGME